MKKLLLILTFFSLFINDNAKGDNYVFFGGGLNYSKAYYNIQSPYYNFNYSNMLSPFFSLSFDVSLKKNFGLEVDLMYNRLGFGSGEVQLTDILGNYNGTLETFYASDYVGIASKIKYNILKKKSNFYLFTSPQIDFRIKDYAFFKKGDGFKFMNNEEERLLNFYGQTYNFDKI
tara:strand:+ start:2052 stop:2573 length:522 start_codon:yes stop_codon:yes gene_type:complete